MRVMNISETYDFLRHTTNLFNESLKMDFEILEFAVKKSLIFPVGKNFFIPGVITAFNSLYKIKEVYQVKEQEIHEFNLMYPYRAKASLFKAFGEYSDNVIKYHSQIDIALEGLDE